jgi:hypothetical protein
MEDMEDSDGDEAFDFFMEDPQFLCRLKHKTATLAKSDHA